MAKKNPGGRRGRAPHESDNPSRSMDERLGQLAYDAYCAARGWKGHDGSLLPRWPDVKTDIKVAWMISARAVVAARN